MSAQKQMWWKVLRHQGEILFEVYVNKDGTLYNPHGYPEELVRAACAVADARRHATMSRAAKKAAATRKARQDAKVYEVSQGIIDGNTYGPAKTCVCCWKGLDDPDSIRRGIGSDCWQRVLKLIHQSKAGVA